MYNNSLAFASFNANIVKFNSLQRAPYCFKVQGQIYYQINKALYPEKDENQNFGQLFIIDPEEALEYRIAQGKNLHRELLQSLDMTLRSCNIFAKSYQMMNEEITMQTEVDMLNNENNIPEVRLLSTLRPGVDKNRFNFPRTNEVAAVFCTTADGEIPHSSKSFNVYWPQIVCINF